jgi:hypothetical protein
VKEERKKGDGSGPSALGEGRGKRGRRRRKSGSQRTGKTLHNPVSMSSGPRDDDLRDGLPSLAG